MGNNDPLAKQLQSLRKTNPAVAKAMAANMEHQRSQLLELLASPFEPAETAALRGAAGVYADMIAHLTETPAERIRREHSSDGPTDRYGDY